MLIQEIIAAKRDGRTLDENAIERFIEGLTRGEVAAEQASALAMAIFFRGLDFTETGFLTRAMAHSGEVLDWAFEDLGGPVIDKHSTGGVGDKVSLMLAPIAASCGLFVPMISGRGLGHTGGTLDKMAAIPGYDVAPDLARFRKVVREVGCAIIGQTAELAPADRRLYAIRDVTATVESIPLITASILSKKIAAGLDGLVMDVKVGSGAFMRTDEEAAALASSLIGSGNAAGLRVHALLTDMDQPLGSTAGNALEVREAIDYLTGAARDPRLDACVRALVGEMLVVANLAATPAEASDRVDRAIASGAGAETFARMVRALGGPSDLLERPDALPAQAPTVVEAAPLRPGYVIAVDTRELGVAVIELGGGRRRVDDVIDPAVGLSDLAPVGAYVGSDQPLGRVHAAGPGAATRAALRLRAAYQIAEAAPQSRPVVRARMTGQT